MENLLVWKLVGEYCDWLTIFELARVCSDFNQIFNDEYWRQLVQVTYPELTLSKISWKKQWYRMKIIYYRELFEALRYYTTLTTFPDLNSLSLKALMNACEEYRRRIRYVSGNFLTSPVTKSMRNRMAIKKETIINAMSLLSTPFRIILKYTDLEYDELAIYPLLLGIRSDPVETQLAVITSVCYMW